MGRPRKSTYLSCDFETTVYKGQQHTEVWASACVELYTEDVKIFHSIDETWHYFKSLKTNLVCYYHNLKFDGNFWLWYFICDLHLKPATYQIGLRESDVKFQKPKEMENNTFSYSISDKGMWYSIKVKINNYIIELRDSLKLLPFSVKEIGKAFKTKHQKLDMDYEGVRYAGCEITDEERKYIANDVLVVKEALEIMFDQGHTKMTIGSCCLEEYKRIIGADAYKCWFPNIYEIPIDENIYGSPNAGEWIRNSYRGGWCYLARGKENKQYSNGTTADVNSLYPSMMHSESGNKYPIGSPTFWSGNYIPIEAQDASKFFFIRVKTRFYLKENKLPFIQKKGSFWYKGTEMLETSDVYVKELGGYKPFIVGLDGEIKDTRMTMTMTETDYYLFLEHYNTYEFEILDGCYFETLVGLFDSYIDKYKKIKLESKGAMRTLAKLFLNNLYGKMASSKDSSFKLAYEKDGQVLGFMEVVESDKEPGYIPVGSAITSYARNFTIRAAQKNYHGPNERGFIYADTDSIHCDLAPDEIIGVPVDDKAFCHWKLESCWDFGLFVRQKTYVEHVTHEDLEPIDTPYYNIKCAGMPDKCKELFRLSMPTERITNLSKEEQEQLNKQGKEKLEEEKEFISKLNKEELEFLNQPRTLDDFKIGLKIPGKLMPKRIRGGVLLVNTTYEMRG